MSDLGLGVESAHTDKQARRENTDLSAWAAGIAEKRAKQAQAEAKPAAAPAPQKEAEADPRAEAQARYEAARLNFERARPDIEAGKLEAYPTWADAEAALARLHPDNQESWWKATVRNLSPVEAIGGALDYADNAFETARMISERGDQALMEMGIPALTYTPGEGVGTTTDFEEFSKTKNIGDALPDVGDPEKAGIARSIGKFVAGYATAGRALSGIQKVRQVAESGRIGASAVAAFKGAVSDFTGLSEMEGSLANLIQSVPALDNPVTEFLSAKREDPAVVNKLKTALVGAGFGMAFDGVLAGLRAVRAGKMVKGAANEADRLASGMVNEAETSRTMIRETLGDPDDARLLIESGTETAEASAEGAAKAAADGATNPRMNTGGKVGDVYVNWARIDSEDDVKQVIQGLADRFSDSIDSARGPVETFRETVAAAADEDAWKILTERAQGTPLNARQTLAVRQLWTSSGRAVRDLSRRVAAGGGVQDQIALKKMIAVHATIQEQVIGIRTETARALSQWRIPAGESDQFYIGMQNLMQQMGAERDVVAIANNINALADAGRTDAVDAFTLGAAKLEDLKRIGINSADAIRHLFYLSILSGPKTHMRNMGSNVAMLLSDAATTKGAAILGKTLGGQNVPDGEALAKLYGQIEGFRDAFRVSAIAKEAAEAAGQTPRAPVMNALTTGQTGLGVGKIDLPAMGAFLADKWRVDPTSNFGRALDWVDTATQYNTRLMAAEDEIFRTAGFMGEIHAQAFRQATNEVASGVLAKEAIQDRIAELSRTPSVAMRMLALKHSARLVMADKPAQNSPLYRFLQGVAKVPVLGRLAMPFTRTAYNVAIESAQWTGLAPLTARFMESMKAGGAQADIAWTKFLAGNMALIALADVAIKGGLTGADRGLGGSDVSRGETETARLAGRMPGSIRWETDDGTAVNVQYRGLEPVSLALGMAANVVEILNSDEFDEDDKEIDDLVIAASAAIATQVTAPSFMSGLTDTITMMDDPTRGAGRYFNRVAGTVVPALVYEVTKQQDPIVREVNSAIDAIKAKTPGLSKSLPPATDRWGRDIRRDSGLGMAYDVLSPFAMKLVKVEPIDRELERLEVGLAKPDKTQWIDGIKVNMKMHPKEFTDFVKLAGSEMTETVEGDPITVNSIGYESEGEGLLAELNAIIEKRHAFSDIYYDEEATDGPDGDRAAFIAAIVNAYRAEAKVHLLNKYPAFRAKVLSRYEGKPARGFGPENDPDALIRTGGVE